MKPPKNQRVSSKSQRRQQHLLEVGIRVGKERERRFFAILGFIFKTVLLGAVVSVLWLGGKEAWRRLVWENPDCLVREPAVRTDGTLTREQILAAADIVDGRNILTVNLGRSRAALEKLPQVESAEVLRSFPNHVEINITERRPIAWVTLKKDEDPTTSERSFLIDARSIVLRSRVLLPEYCHLPVISGVETENLVCGQRVNTFEMLAALELVRLNADSTRFQARNIDLAKGYCLVVTDQRRAKITFSLERIDAQLARLNQLLDWIEPTHREIRTINLIPVRNVPVTFYPTEAESPAPAAEPPPPKPETKETKGKPDRNPPKNTTARTKKQPRPAAKKPAATPAEPSEKPPLPDSTPPPAEPWKKPFNLHG